MVCFLWSMINGMFRRVRSIEYLVGGLRRDIRRDLGPATRHPATHRPHHSTALWINAVVCSYILWLTLTTLPYTRSTWYMFVVTPFAFGNIYMQACLDMRVDIPSVDQRRRCSCFLSSYVRAHVSAQILHFFAEYVQAHILTHVAHTSAHMSAHMST